MLCENILFLALVLALALALALEDRKNLAVIIYLFKKSL
jgi:hypothetical protein